MNDTPNTPDTDDTWDTRDTPDTPDTHHTHETRITLGGGTVTVASSTKVTPSKPAAQSATMILGVDSLARSTSAIFNNARSTDHLGESPQFWGRYFHAPGQTNSGGASGDPDMYSAQENGFLRSQNIRVLPIARQTTRVMRGATEGSDDAKKNVAAIFEAFPPGYLSGADPDVLVFLDVEAGTPMTEAYYTAWSSTLMSEASVASNSGVRFHPAVYSSLSANAVWRALKDAMDKGAICDGIWIARYYHGTPNPYPWDDNLMKLPVNLLCPALAWQYWASANNAPPAKNFDTNVANPAHADMLLGRLVLPPASELVA